MTTTAIKKQIHQAIDAIESPEILKAVQLILNQEDKTQTRNYEHFYLRRVLCKK